MTSIFTPSPIVTACITQFGLDLAGEIRVDLFAGGGGATMGQEMATGKAVDIAINHNPKAISMHSRRTTGHHLRQGQRRALCVGGGLHRAA